MKYVSNMSIPKIHEWYQGIGIHISRSCISSILTGKHIDVFHREKAQIYETSLEISSYQQIDDTGSRVNGKNCYTQIMCNPLCTLFFTTERKDRLTVLDVLRNFRARSFIFNTESFELFEKLKVSKSNISLMHKFKQNVSFDDQRMQEILKEIFPDPNKDQRNRIRVMEACAISCYHQEESIPVVKLLLSDDAPQFKLITKNLALCWIHECRHYRRLSPLYEPHQEQLELFLKSFCARARKLTS